MKESYNKNPESASQIYEGGNYHGITVNDLVDNEVAIRQILNELNSVRKERDDKLIVVQELKSENEYLKSSPFVATIGMLISILGSTIGGIGLSFLNTNYNTHGWVLVIVGALLLIIGGVAPILYPYARVWLNKIDTTVK